MFRIGKESGEERREREEMVLNFGYSKSLRIAHCR